MEIHDITDYSCFVLQICICFLREAIAIYFLDARQILLLYLLKALANKIYVFLFPTVMKCLHCILISIICLRAAIGFTTNFSTNQNAETCSLHGVHTKWLDDKSYPYSLRLSFRLWCISE